MKKLLIPALLLGALPLSGQIRNPDVYELPEMNAGIERAIIRIPDVNGFKALKCDFHTHTVFSDGLVWPTVRVDEAWQDGLDAIAITDHIEYRPFKNHVQGDLNTSYDIARKAADRIGFIVIKGIEITRDKPFGHMNALFIKDAAPLETPDPRNALDEALKQGAFIMWNHPGWPDNKSTKSGIHDTLIREGKIHGVEVFNGREYYPVSLDWCRDLKLAFMGNSDIHGTIADSYPARQPGRPFTLAFARERSAEGIREALFAGRTVVLFNDELAGPEELLRDLVKASIDVRVVGSNEKSYTVELSNLSDIPYKGRCGDTPLLLPANKTVRATLPKKGMIEVLNCHIGNGETLQIAYPLP